MSPCKHAAIMTSLFTSATAMAASERLNEVHVVESKSKCKSRWCFVPLCKNTEKNSEKVFLTVPRKGKRRKLWFEVARRRDSTVITKAQFYCCEDHFDVSIVTMISIFHYLVENSPISAFSYSPVGSPW